VFFLSVLADLYHTLNMSDNKPDTLVTLATEVAVKTVTVEEVTVKVECKEHRQSPPTVRFFSHFTFTTLVYSFRHTFHIKSII